MSSASAEICMQKLWATIIKSHCVYLAEEEGLQKIEKRTTLESKWSNRF